MSGFNIDWWGNHYFSVNDKGHVEVCPDPDVPEARVDLAELVSAREKNAMATLATTSSCSRSRLISTAV